MSLVNTKTCLITLFVVLFGWFFNSTAVPVFFPAFVGTPVAGLVSVICSVLVWVILAALFAAHDRSVTKQAVAKK